MKFRPTLLLLCLLPLMLLLGASQDQDRQEYIKDVRTSLKRFGEVYRQLSFRYVDQIDPEAGIEAAIRGLMHELDPYTDYFVEEEARDLDEMSQGEYGGIGAEVGQRGSDKRVTIISPFDDSPADKVGLRAGDIIDAVDGVSTLDRSLSEVVGEIKGPRGTKVTLSILRAGWSKAVDYTLTRDVIVIRDVRYAGIVDEDQALGYVRLTRFSGKASESLSEAIEGLKAQGMRGLILDLRGNPGGLLREAGDVADLFLEPGLPIVDTRDRQGNVEKDIRSEHEPVFDGPLLVMIDGSSASASEIVAGALQDHDRAVVLGTNSYGKGLVQSVYTIDDDARLKLTTARYYLPSGRLIQRIDYFENNDVLNHVETASLLSDSLFVTDDGRPVVGGRGIQPDLEVKYEPTPWFVSELWRAGLFTNFLADAKPALKPTAEVDAHMLKRFHEFVLATEQEFDTPGSKELEDLATLIEREQLGETASTALEELRSAMGGDTQAQLEQNENWLIKMLTLEQAERRGGSEERAKASLLFDAQFDRAVQLLNSDGEFRALLSAPVERADID